MSSDSLTSRFKSQSIEPNEFNHLAHLKVAWDYICEYSPAQAREYFHKDIIQLTKALGVEDKYHRTLTDFFLDYLYQVKWYFNTESWELIELNCPLLVAHAQKLIGYYYSDDVMNSDIAKQQYVEADIMPLDRASLRLSDTDIPVFDVVQHDSPIIVSMPHHGQFIPHDVLQQMTPVALDSADTDWYLVQLYRFLEALNITRINANYSRYLIDLNRDSSGKVLYKGADNTELCPTSTFDLEALYEEGSEPDAQEVARRTELYWKPYHQELERLIKQAKDKFGYCLLFEAHTIQSHVPRFFDGQLPDFNFGTNEGQTVNSELKTLLEKFDTGNYSKIINGRFKGGFITRQYAKPEDNIYTIQLELSQATYLDEKLRLYDEQKADKASRVIDNLLQNLKAYL
jgi:N-formylglutamate deformylase